MNIFVGNLPYGATDGDLREAFEAYGSVSSASVIVDKFTGKSRGFGFVEMPDAEQAKAAIAGLNDQDLHGRPIRVNEAKPREDRPPRREGGGGGFRDRGDREGGYSQRRSSGGYGHRG
ncbi:MAG: RNA recognition motif domain-containing protein [Kiritimatiellia bacterium]